MCVRAYVRESTCAVQLHGTTLVLIAADATCIVRVPADYRAERDWSAMSSALGYTKVSTLVCFLFTTVTHEGSYARLSLSLFFFSLSLPSFFRALSFSPCLSPSLDVCASV